MARIVKQLLETSNQALGSDSMSADTSLYAQRIATMIAYPPGSVPGSVRVVVAWLQTWQILVCTGLH